MVLIERENSGLKKDTFSLVDECGDFITMQGKYAASHAGKSERQQNDPGTSIIIILL